ncbi:hypothetical protein [Pseudomonas grimontii]|uniref:hypothetical protein n=1 Tax=Pseudomonas grimontii TaxID=129847 RepID=UPI0028E45649|nr:hypothetical protein [Pseudomonas grimontii]
MLIKKTLAVAVVFICFNLLLLVFLKFESGLVSKYISCLVFISFFIYLWLLFRGARAFLLSSYFSIFYFVFLFISAASAEEGAYMLEAGKYGSLNGATLVVATFFIVCLETGKFSYSWVESFAGKISYPRFSNFTEKLVAGLILFLTLVLCGYVLFRYSGSFLLGVERADYLSRVVPPWVAIVKSLSLQSFLICVTAYFMSKQPLTKRIFGLGLLGILACLIIIFGEKFSALNLCVMFSLMALAGRAPNFNFSRGIILFCAFALVSVLSLVAYSYVSLGRDPDFIFTRVVLQSQVIWSVMDAPLNVILWGNGGGCFFGCESFNTGAQYLDYLVLPEALYEFYQRSGTSLSGYFPAVLIHQYGLLVSMIVAVIGSFFLAGVQAFLVIAIRKGALLFSFVLFKIYYMVLAFLYFGQIGVFNEVVVVCIVVGLLMILLANVVRYESTNLGAGK